MNKQKNCNNIWRVDYLDSDGTKGYSYFVDHYQIKFSMTAIVNLAAYKLHLPLSDIIGIRKMSKLPSYIGDCYFTI